MSQYANRGNTLSKCRAMSADVDAVSQSAHDNHIVNLFILVLDERLAEVLTVGSCMASAYNAYDF